MSPEVTMEKPLLIGGLIKLSGVIGAGVRIVRPNWRIWMLESEIWQHLVMGARICCIAAESTLRHSCLKLSNLFLKYISKPPP